MYPEEPTWGAPYAMDPIVSPEDGTVWGIRYEREKGILISIELYINPYQDILNGDALIVAKVNILYANITLSYPIPSYCRYLAF